MDLVDLPWPDPASRPLKTILELKQLRDLIAHGKSERLVVRPIIGRAALVDRKMQPWRDSAKSLRRDLN